MIEVSSFGWVLRGTGDSVAATFYADGEVADPDTVTVDIARADGTILATGRTTAGADDAPRTVVLTPTETADLDILTLTWHTEISTVAMDFVTTAEIVGAHLFTIAEARTFDKAQLTNPTKYPEAAIEEARARIGDAFARICGVDFVPRYRRVVLDGSYDQGGYGWNTDPLLNWPAGQGILLPSTRVSAVRAVETRVAGAATWAAFDADDLADVVLLPEGVIYRETRGGWPWGQRNVRVGYEAGYSQPPPDIKRAALILLIDQLVTKDISERALSQTTEFGTFRIATAGERGSYFGLPLVDSVLDLYVRQRVPVIR